MTTAPHSREPLAAQGTNAPRRLDPWLVAVAASALLPLLKSWGAPLGEPVADDFDFLRRALLERGSLFDSGGAVIYWRPLARQIYYALAGPLMLSNPLAVALIHVALLMGSAVLLYRGFRPAWGSARAAVIATFPVVTESARVLILWPAAFQDLGALLFSALALHECSRRRLPTTLLALLAALLCKEVSIVVALLLPWMPEPLGKPPRDRKRWAIAITGLVAGWGIAYAIVLRSANVLFQSQLEGARPPILERWLWALRSSVLDGFSLQGSSSLWAWVIVLAVMGAFLAAFLLGGKTSRANRGRVLSWLAWGAAWFALCAVTLGETFPVWGSFRTTLGLVGFGVACVAALVTAPPVWLAALAAARIVLLLVAPAPPASITLAPPGDGAGFDLVTMARLQRVSHETRIALDPAETRVGRGATVTWLHRPVMSDRAFAHSKALHVWFRDTTVHWIPWQEAIENPDRDFGAGLEYDVNAPRQIIRVPPAALKELAAAMQAMRSGDFQMALARLGRADSLQIDRGAAVFLGTLAGKRALSLLSLDEFAAARFEAQRGLATWPLGADSRYVMAVALATDGRFHDALAQLDTVLLLYPNDAAAKLLRDTLSVMARGE